MQIEELSNKGLKREYEVTLGKDAIDAKMNEQLKEIAKNIRIPGFRPGKVPPELIRKQHGDRVMGEVLEQLVNESTTKVFKDKDLKPAMQPKVEVVDFGEGKDLKYKMEIEVLPSIEIPDFSGIKLERLTVKIDSKEVDKALKELAAQQKAFEKAPKTYAAKNGDAVFIDYKGLKDGVAFDGGTAEEFQLELGSGMFIPGFEDQLVGVKAGDERSINVTFPENYGTKDLAGAPVVFEIKVREVRKPTEAKIDDDFAKNFGLDDLKALKEALSDRLSQEYDNTSRSILKRRLLDELEDICDFDVPEGMVEMEFQQIWERIKMDAINAGDATLKDFEGKTGPDDEAERAEYTEIAARRVRLGLLLSEVGQKREVTIPQEDVTRAIMQEAQRYPGQEKEVMDYFRQNEQAMAQLRAPIYEAKVCDLILAETKFTEKAVTKDELEKAFAALDSDETPKKKSKGAKKAPAKAKKAPAKKKVEAKKAPAKKEAAKKAPAKKATAKKSK